VFTQVIGCQHVKRYPCDRDIKVGDLERVFDTGTLVGPRQATLRAIIQALKETYCGTIGLEYMYITDTAQNTGMVLTVAFDYGSHSELVHAAVAAAAEGPIDQAAIERNLYLPELPPVDVMVRTSGELRISNFMLWQSVGAEVYFTDRPWPDFDGHELDAALALVA